MSNNPLSNIDPSGLACYPLEKAMFGNCAGFMNGVNSGGSWNEFDVMNIPVFQLIGYIGTRVIDPATGQVLGISYTPIFDQVGTGFDLLTSSWLSAANNGTWQSIKNLARKIGNYIPTPCGGGVFAYGGRMAGPTAATVQVAKWGQYDTRDGTSSGIFTELSGGELLTVGVGQQGPLGGAQEHYLFVGAGGDAKFAGMGVQGNISALGSDSASFGYAAEGGLGKWSGGVGIYQNFDTLTSCIDHGGR